MLRALKLFLQSITRAVKFTGRLNVTLEKLEIILKTAKKKKVTVPHNPIKHLGLTSILLGCHQQC